MDNVVWAEDSFVAGWEDDTAGDEVDQVDVNEALGRSILALAQDKAQVRIDVLEQNRPVKKINNCWKLYTKHPKSKHLTFLSGFIMIWSRD